MLSNIKSQLVRFSIIFWCVCSIQSDTSEEIFESEFKIKPQFLDGFEKFRTMFLEDIRLSDDILSNEIINDFMLTLKACQKGLDKAADKVTYLLDLLSEDMPNKDEEEQKEEEEEGDGRGEKQEDSVMGDELYEVYSPKEEETSVLQENYVRDIRKVFKTLTHACNSLPKTLPRIHSRKQRNPQTTAQRLAISLKRWAEKWLNLVEVRLEDFLVACVKDKNCERYFHKVIKMLVDILEEYQFYLDKNTSSLLQEFQRYKSSPSMDTMNYIQRASLIIGDSFGNFKEDDSSYHIARGIHDNKIEGNWFNFGVDGNDGLQFLSNIFHEVQHKTTPNAIIEFDEDKIVHKVPKTFLSSAFGTSLIQDGWREAKTQKDKFVKIVSALSPALFRVGGSGANFLTYDPLSSFETVSINSNSPQVDPLGVQHHKGYSTRKKNNRNRSGRRMARDTPKRHLKGVRNQYMIETNELTMDMDHSFDFEELCEVQNEVGKVFTNFTMTTETATAWGGGAPVLSYSFASCFPWLDKLGSAAIGGISAVFRQTLYGGCYALIDDELNPYPNYWVSVLHKKIMGQEVLLPRVRMAKQTLRIYAHCLEHDHPLEKQGAIVILILNLSNEKETVQLIGESLKSSPKYLYELSAPNGNLLSRDILLNKKVLKLNDDGSLPDFEPVLVQTEDLLVPPLTVTFWVLPEAEYQACSKQ
ncbi:Heparanase [Armadillidium vulgare]|nr:Heparanase [Armadillidium vulgare]